MFFLPCKSYLLTESHLGGDPWEHKASPSGPQLTWKQLRFALRELQRVVMRLCWPSYQNMKLCLEKNFRCQCHYVKCTYVY